MLGALITSISHRPSSPVVFSRARARHFKTQANTQPSTCFSSPDAPLRRERMFTRLCFAFKEAFSALTALPERWQVAISPAIDDHPQQPSPRSIKQDCLYFIDTCIQCLEQEEGRGSSSAITHTPQFTRATTLSRLGSLLSLLTKRVLKSAQEQTTIHSLVFEGTYQKAQQLPLQLKPFVRNCPPLLNTPSILQSNPTLTQHLYAYLSPPPAQHIERPVGYV
ncbi:hypothetical protein Q7P37_004395 [Cladosporium fusiforme]